MTDTYKLFFEHSNELLCVADLTFYFLELNPTWERVLGWSLDELRAHPYTSFVHPDDLVRTIDEAQRFHDQNYGCLAFRNRYRHKNGSYRWLNWSCRRSPGEEYIYAIVTDITDQVRDDLISKHCQALTNAGGWEYDIASDELYWSHQVYTIFGVDPKHFVATSSSVVHFFSEDDNVFIMQKFQELVSNGVFYDIDVPMVRGDGVKGWVNIQARTVDATGETKKVYGSVCDISARKLKELDDRKHERFLSTVLDNLPVALFCKDYEDEGRYLVWNRMAEKLWGIPSERVIGKRDADILPQDIVERFSKEDQAAFLTRENYVYEDDWPFKQRGEDTVTRTVKLPIEGFHGPDGMIIGIAQDISLQKRTEHLLRAREQEALVAKNRLELAIAATGIGVWDWNLESGVVDIDDRIRAIYGIGNDPIDIVKEKLAKGVHPDDYERLMGTIRNAIINRSLCDSEFRLSANAGAGRYMRMMAQACYRDDGAVEKIIGVILDITQSKLREIALREQKEKLQEIVDNIPVMIAFVAPSGEIDWVNPEARSVLGQNLSTGTGPLLKSLFPNHRDRFSAMRLFRASPKEWFDLSITARYGETLLIRWASVTLSSGHQIIIGQDITLRKQQERLIEDQRVKMLNSSKMSALGKMAGSIAHEINNPLAIIRGAADLLEDILSNTNILNQQTSAILKKIQITVERVAKIVKGLRAFSRDGDSDPMALCSLSEIITDTLNFCMTNWAYQRIKLTLNLPEEDIYVYCKAVQISQVVLNLLNNATDAIDPEAGGWIQIDVVGDEQMVRVSVTDSGKGIPLHIANKIMEPFFTTKVLGKGSGLGLSISRQIIEAHGGRLSLDASSQKATRFEFQIPKIPHAAQLDSTGGATAKAELSQRPSGPLTTRS